MSPIRYKRRRHLFGAWAGDRLELRVTATGASLQVAPGHVALLEACGSWATPEEVAALVGRDVTHVASDLEWLASASLLMRSGEDGRERERALDSWGPWAPVASSFHFATRDLRYVAPFGPHKPVLVSAPEPAALKEYPGRATTPLPPFSTGGELAEALRGRRSWRTFGTRRPGVEEVATLLGLTWAVQHWACFDGVGRQALKTSPSGGARHSVEAYVGVRDVEGLEPGLYHYAPDAHGLTLLREGFTSEDIVTFLPEQPMYGGASFVVFQTSVFGRVRWRYPNPRAYRNIFIEAGHLAQTFLTMATHLGLAPFCTAALAETLIEQALEIDTVEESVLYVVGAGPRPDLTWAPLPDGEQRGRLEPPSYRTRFSEDAS